MDLENVELMMWKQEKASLLFQGELRLYFGPTYSSLGVKDFLHIEIDTREATVNKKTICFQGYQTFFSKNITKLVTIRQNKLGNI